MKMSKRRFIHLMSGIKRWSILSPGNPGIPTKRPPFTVLHRCVAIFSLRMPAAGDAAIARTPTVSASSPHAQRARNPFPKLAIGRLNRQRPPDPEIVHPDDRPRSRSRHPDPAEGLV